MLGEGVVRLPADSLRERLYPLSCGIQVMPMLQLTHRYTMYPA